MISTPKDVVQSFLENFSRYIVAEDLESIGSLFLPSDGWLRDQLILSWNYRSVCGRKDILEYLTPRLHKTSLYNIQLDEEHDIQPNLRIEQETGSQTVEAVFKFETSLLKGRGYLLLVFDGTTWKALLIYLGAAELKGHEENTIRPSGYYGGHTKTWMEHVEEEREKIENDPHVIILGAAQCGLMVAARFRQMSIPTLLIERSDRVGDTWRERYPSLTLHTVNSHHTMLYTRYPTNWPVFTSKDQFANTLEQYAVNQELTVWTSSTILPTPSYDPKTKRWTVRISKAGEEVVLHPYHLVLAIGTFGKPYIPSVPGLKGFKGFHCHTANYNGHKAFTGKKVIVVGASQSSADICQNLALHGVDVTMVQRSGTIVVSVEYVWKKSWEVSFPLNKDYSTGDLRAFCIPVGLIKKVQIRLKDSRIQAHKDMLEGLKKAGFNATQGPDGQGHLGAWYDKLGGYWFDIGTAGLIIEGRVKLKSGSELEQFTPSGVLFKDGTSMEADAVIFATGYEPVKNAISGIFGEDLAKKVTPVWGVGEDGELRQAYKPSGQPGLWWAIGDFMAARHLSKLLGIQIKAQMLGLVPEE